MLKVVASMDCVPIISVADEVGAGDSDEGSFVRQSQIKINGKGSRGRYKRQLKAMADCGARYVV